jgi:RNA polymerase sigma-70 factor (ECF subfamily)
MIRYLTCFLHGDVHAAHDVAQDVLVQAWHALESIEGAAHLRRWCYRVARCRAITWIRKRGPPGRPMESLDVLRDDDTHPDPEATEQAPPSHPESRLTRSLRRAMRRLPADYAAPLTLHYVQGCTTRETAELLGLNRTTVKMRLHRARALLRRELEEDPSAWSHPHTPSDATAPHDPSNRSCP